MLEQIDNNMFQLILLSKFTDPAQRLAQQLLHCYVQILFETGMEQKMLCTEQHLPEVFSDMESVFMGQLREFI